MICPLCKTQDLKKQVFYGVEIDYCPRCLGMWFERDELQQAKDEKDNNLNWLDIDLWDEEKKFKISPSGKICPSCSTPLYEVNYGDSEIKVDVCNLCEGVWIDRGEFRKIIDYLREKEKYEVIHHYFKNVAKEGLELFTGPEEFKSELSDFLTLLKLLNYKLAIQYPLINKLISSLPI